jgi:O-antigen ligase
MLSLSEREPTAHVELTMPEAAPRVPGRSLVTYSWWLGVILAGYMLLDRAFAYIHIPGTPLYVGETVLVIGIFGVLAATGYLRVVVREEPIFALLAAFFLWGLIRFVPGFHTYGIDAVRDFALCYYCIFAFLIAAALARSPEILERLVVKFDRFIPWLLIWLPIGLILQQVVKIPPNMPGTSVSLLAHKPGNAAIAAALALGCLWLFPERRSARSRAFWSIVALFTIVLAATQNRGGLLGSGAGLIVGLVYLKDRARLIIRALVVIVLGLGLAVVLSLQVPTPAGPAVQGQRAFSASQLFANLGSLVGANSSSNLVGTEDGRTQLWSLIYQKQVDDALLIRGSGFGPNLAYEVGVYESSPTDPLRSPHNSHLDILARMGLLGLVLWIALWLGWYWRLIVGCQRLARRGLHFRRQVAVLCMMTTTAFLVSSFFDPQLEGAQVAALVWTAFGIGVAVTSFRGWFGRQIPTLATSGSPPISRSVPA